MADSLREIPDRGPELRAINIFFFAITIVAVSLRCYVRIGMVKAFGVDDWLMLAATVFFTLYCGFSTAGIYYGTGRHRSDLPIEGYEMGMRCWWFCYLWYAMSMIFSKLSVGWFLLRLVTKKLQIWIVYIAMFCTAAAGLTFFFVTIFQCAPVSFFWFERQEGSCISANVIIGLAILYSCFACLSDLTFAILPGFLVWSLKMKMRTKLALVPLLAMGCVASCAVIARFPFLFQIRSRDFLWATLDVAIWSTVEQGLTITAASLATLRPLMKAVGYRMGWTQAKSSNFGNTGEYYGNQSYGLRYGTTSKAAPGARNSAFNNLTSPTMNKEAYQLSSSASNSPIHTRSDPWGDNKEPVITNSAPKHNSHHISDQYAPHKLQKPQRARIDTSHQDESISEESVSYVIQSPTTPPKGSLNTMRIAVRTEFSVQSHSNESEEHLHRPRRAS